MKSNDFNDSFDILEAGIDSSELDDISSIVIWLMLAMKTIVL